MTTFTPLPCDEPLVRWQLAQQLALAAEAVLQAQLEAYAEGSGAAPSADFIAEGQRLRARAVQALGELLARNRAQQAALPLL